MTHATDHAEMLQRALVGDLAPDDAAFAARLAGCGECRARWDGMRALVQRLDSARIEMEHDLAAARAMDGAPGSDLVAAAVARARAETAAPSVRSHDLARRGLWVALALAAAIVALLAGRMLMQPGERRDDVTLGEASLHVSPLGGVRRDAIEYLSRAALRFAWRFEGATAFTRYDLDVEGRDSSTSPWHAIETPTHPLEMPEWTPPSETVRAWPRELRFRVTVAASADGRAPVGSGWIRFSLTD